MSGAASEQLALLASFAEAGLSIPLVKEGKLRALAVTASQRLPLLPDVPPFSEAANAPDYEGVSWHMLLMSSKTPRPIADRLHAEMKRIMADPQMQAIFIAWGAGVPKGIRLGEISNLDVAPTLAALLGIEMKGVKGHALNGFTRT